MLDAQQRSVGIGMAAAAIGSAAFLYFGHRYLPPFVPVITSPEARVLYALRWDVLAALMLAAGLARVAQRRFFSREDIEGGEPKPGSGIDIDRRYVQNTAEQLLLFLVAHVALAAQLPATSTRLLPLLTMWFVIARIAFWFGYHRHALARSFGFAATFYPTVGVLVYDAVLLVRG